jgi:hypothetical protein
MPSAQKGAATDRLASQAWAYSWTGAMLAAALMPAVAGKGGPAAVTMRRAASLPLQCKPLTPAVTPATSLSLDPPRGPVFAHGLSLIEAGMPTGDRVQLSSARSFLSSFL